MIKEEMRLGLLATKVIIPKKYRKIIVRNSQQNDIFVKCGEKKFTVRSNSYFEHSNKLDFTEDDIVNISGKKNSIVIIEYYE